MYSYFALYGTHNEARHMQQAMHVAEVGAKARRAQDSSQVLRRDFERLRLATTALWEIVRDHHGFNDEVLLAKISEIDLRDGVEDGRMRPGPVNCSRCERVNKATRKACLYCGEPLSPSSAV